MQVRFPVCETWKLHKRQVQLIDLINKQQSSNIIRRHICAEYVHASPAFSLTKLQDSVAQACSGRLLSSDGQRGFGVGGSGFPGLSARLWAHWAVEYYPPGKKSTNFVRGTSLSLVICEWVTNPLYHSIRVQGDQIRPLRTSLVLLHVCSHSKSPQEGGDLPFAFCSPYSFRLLFEWCWRVSASPRHQAFRRISRFLILPPQKCFLLLPTLLGDCLTDQISAPKSTLQSNRPIALPPQ